MRFRLFDAKRILHYLLWEVSFANLQMYLSSIEGEDEEGQEVVKEIDDADEMAKLMGL